MTAQANLPSQMNFKGNLSENFKKFRQAFEIYLLATEKHKKSDEIKIAILLNVIGEEGVEVFNNFTLNVAERKDYNRVIGEFEVYVNPRKNVIYERFKFYGKNQAEQEPFDNFLQEIKTLVKTCEFKDAEEMIRDRIVLGICDKKLQEKLLNQEDLTLTMCIKMCRAQELLKVQLQNVQNKGFVDEVRNEKQGKYKKNMKTEDFQKYKKNMKTEDFHCKRCNSWHGPGNCKAYGKKCSRCGKLNHFAVVCKSKVQEKTVERGKRRNVAELNTALSQDDEDEEFYLDTVVSTLQANGKEWKQVLNIQGEVIEFKLDTGAEVNILAKKEYDHIMRNNPGLKGGLRNTSMTLKAYGGSMIEPLGIISFNCKTRGKIVNVEFVVVDSNKSLLGLYDCNRLGFVKKLDAIDTEYTDLNSFLKSNEEVFVGLGAFKEKCRIKLKRDAKPVVMPPRRVPLAIRDRLKSKLDELEKKGIISKVQGPIEWLSNLVIIEKKDKSLRLCLDPQELNKAIEKEFCLIPTLEDIAVQLRGKSVYTVLDLKDGFYQVPLDSSSSRLCSFSSPFGPYKFNRLPFGVSIAAQYFQRVNSGHFSGIEGVMIYIDDIIIAADNVRQHDEILSKVMQRARECNIKFNKTKVQFRKNKVNYLGHTFECHGMRPDENKIEAVKQLVDPKSKVELQRILGMINYLRSFIPNLSTLTAPLRSLLKKDVEFSWIDIHKKTLDELKNIISKAPILRVFDNKILPVIQTDASKNGLGCVLLQAGKPVAFASRALTETEKGYAQIEKEFLAVVYSLRKFHQYVYGRKVQIVTDHKPLISIMNKPLFKIDNSRLQRIRLKLVKYDIELIYKPGKEMHIADLLSRNYIKVEERDDEFVSEVVHNVEVNLQMSDERKKIFKELSLDDDELSKLRDYYVNGWPKSYKSVAEIVKPYWNFRNDIYVENNLIFYKHRVIVPVKIRNEMLIKLHEGHFGMTKTKLRAKEILFWPSMYNQIEKTISSCNICEKFQNANIRNFLMPHEVPKYPFQKIAVDILDFAGKSYLVVCDYYSKWLEILLIRNKTALEAVRLLKPIFATHGVPSIIIADNMPFASYEFDKFAKEWDIMVKTTSPHYSRSNGLAERGVQTAKNILRKGVDIDIALLEYRSTPISGIDLSPSQMLFNRRIKTKLPVSTNLLQPKVQNSQVVRHKLHNKQKLYKQYYDKRAKNLKDFEKGDNVLINVDRAVNKKWESGVNVGKADAPRSYWIKNTKGNIVRRNREHLRKSENGCKNIDDNNDVGRGSNNVTGNRKENVNVRIRKMPERFSKYVMY